MLAKSTTSKPTTPYGPNSTMSGVSGQRTPPTVGKLSGLHLANISTQRSSTSSTGIPRPASTIAQAKAALFERASQTPLPITPTFTPKRSSVSSVNSTSSSFRKSASPMTPSRKLSVGSGLHLKDKDNLDGAQMSPTSSPSTTTTTPSGSSLIGNTSFRRSPTSTINSFQNATPNSPSATFTPSSFRKPSVSSSNGFGDRLNSAETPLSTSSPVPVARTPNDVQAAAIAPLETKTGDAAMLVERNAEDTPAPIELVVLAVEAELPKVEIPTAPVDPVTQFMDQAPVEEVAAADIEMLTKVENSPAGDVAAPVETAAECVLMPEVLIPGEVETPSQAVAAENIKETPLAAATVDQGILLKEETTAVPDITEKTASISIEESIEAGSPLQSVKEMTQQDTTSSVEDTIETKVQAEDINVLTEEATTMETKADSSVEDSTTRVDEIAITEATAPGEALIELETPDEEHSPASKADKVKASIEDIEAGAPCEEAFEAEAPIGKVVAPIKVAMDGSHEKAEASVETNDEDETSVDSTVGIEECVAEEAADPAEEIASVKIADVSEEVGPAQEAASIDTGVPIEEIAAPKDEATVFTDEEVAPIDPTPIDPTPVEESTPVEEAAPIEEPSQFEKATPVVETDIAEEVASIEEPTPVVEEVTPVDEPAPAEEAIPTEEIKEDAEMEVSESETLAEVENSAEESKTTEQAIEQMIDEEVLSLGIESANMAPQKLQWRHGGHHVNVTGTFDNWQGTVVLSRDGNSFSGTVHLDRTRSNHFKFVVDGAWMCSSDYATEHDGSGNINNVLHSVSWNHFLPSSS